MASRSCRTAAAWRSLYLPVLPGVYKPRATAGTALHQVVRTHLGACFRYQPRGYPRRHARAIATFMVAAFRGLLIDLVANKDRARLDDAMEIMTLVTRVMEAKGPAAARGVLAGADRRDGRGRGRRRETRCRASRRS
jgi:hypothetical protein